MAIFSYCTTHHKYEGEILIFFTKNEGWPRICIFCELINSHAHISEDLQTEIGSEEYDTKHKLHHESPKDDMPVDLKS